MANDEQVGAEQVASDIERKAASARRAIGAIRSSGTTDGGSVTVSVDGGGRLIDLALSARALNNTPARLAGLITQAYEAAASDAARAVDAALSDLTSDKRLAGAMSYVREFSDRVDADSQLKARSARPPRRDEDDGPPRSFLERVL